MNAVGLVVIGVLFEGHVLQAHERWTCTTTTDLFGSSSNNELEKRVSDLEERVRRIEDHGISKIPTDCEEIYKNGTRINGAYKISPDGRSPFLVSCDMTNGGWTLIQNRIDDSVPFNRNWSEYETGFGDLQGSHWLGLEKIHRLTRNGSQIRFDMERIDGSKVYAQYKSFRVDDASTSYTMHVNVSGYSGSIPELLSFHDGMKFSTFDRDNDANVRSHCSQLLGYGGWWYQSCYRLGNLNGLYGRNNSEGFTYTDIKTYWYLKTASIKVKGL